MIIIVFESRQPSWSKATIITIKCSFFTCSDFLVVCYIVYYFVTEDLKNWREIKTKNPKQNKKLSKKCHCMAG